MTFVSDDQWLQVTHVRRRSWSNALRDLCDKLAMTSANNRHSQNSVCLSFSLSLSLTAHTSEQYETKSMI